MNNSKIVLALAALALWGLPSLASAKTGWVDASVLNVRKSPGTSSASVGTLTRGQKVDVTAFRSDRWCRISLPGGKSGWVKEEYVRFTAPSSSTSSSSKSTKVTTAWIEPEVANLRKGPDVGTDCAAQLKRGTKVYVVASDGGWRKVKSEGGTWGWIRSDLLVTDAAAGRKLASSGTTPDFAPVPVWIKENVVNVRSGPSVGYSMVGQLTKGDKIYVISSQGDWRKCRTPNGYGWVLRELLETDVQKGRALAGSGGSNGDKAYCVGSSVYLREGPSTSSGSLGQLRQGDTVWVKDEKGSWCKVATLDGRSGWIAGWYVRRHGAQSTIAKSPDDPAPSSRAGDDEEPEVSGQLKPFRAWIADDGTNVRYGAGTDRDVKFSLSKATPVTVVDTQGQWCKVRTTAGNDGWAAGWVLDFQPPGQAEATKVVNGERTEAKAGWINRPSVNVRKGASTSEAVVTQATLGTEVVIIDQKSDWFKVAFTDGTMGWVNQDLVKTRAEHYGNGSSGSGSSSSSTSITSSSGSGSGRAVVREAMRHLGKPYVRGGDGPEVFDCSGLTSYVYRQFGVELARTTTGQYLQGRPVSRDELELGDVLVFQNTYRAGISHVGIYIGQGNFIHAANSRSGVKISDLDSGYYADHYVGARRFF